MYVEYSWAMGIIQLLWVIIDINDVFVYDVVLYNVHIVIFPCWIFHYFPGDQTHHSCGSSIQSNPSATLFGTTTSGPFSKSFFSFSSPCSLPCFSTLCLDTQSRRCWEHKVIHTSQLILHTSALLHNISFLFSESTEFKPFIHRDINKTQLIIK